MEWICLINFRMIVFSFYRCHDRDKVLWIIVRGRAGGVKRGKDLKGPPMLEGVIPCYCYMQWERGGSRLFIDGPGCYAGPLGVTASLASFITASSISVVISQYLLPCTDWLIKMSTFYLLICADFVFFASTLLVLSVVVSLLRGQGLFKVTEL